MDLSHLLRRRTVLLLAGLVALLVCVGFLLRGPERTPTGEPLPRMDLKFLRIVGSAGVEPTRDAEGHLISESLGLRVENNSDWNVTAIRFLIRGDDVWLRPLGAASIPPSSRGQFRYYFGVEKPSLRRRIRDFLRGEPDADYVALLAAEGYREPS